MSYLLSDLKKLTWAPSMMSKVGPDAGLVVMTTETLADKKSKIASKKLFLEFGWSLVKKIGEKAKLEVNARHIVSCNFDFERDPTDPVTIHDLIEALPWKTYVTKILPEDDLK